MGWHDQKAHGLFRTSEASTLIPVGTPPLVLLREDHAEGLAPHKIKVPQKDGKEKIVMKIETKAHILNVLAVKIVGGTVEASPIGIQTLVHKFVGVEVKKVNDYWVKRFQGGMAPGGGSGGIIIGLMIGGLIGLIVGMMMGGGNIQMPQILPPIG